MKNVFIHKLADVQTNNIGEDSKVWQFSVILADAKIGKNVNINAQVFIENHVEIGNNVTVKPGVQIWDGITLEDYVMVGPNVTFTNDLRPRAKAHDFKLLKTTVKKGASIGANATIIGGVTIGEYAMIGAGAVVTKNIPPFTLWVGNPAKYVSQICLCGEKIKENDTCKKCDFNSRIVELQRA